MNHTFLQIQKTTIKTILISILCLQINLIDCTTKRSKPFTDRETTQLINGFKKALDQNSDLDNASLALLEQAIESKETHGKSLLNYLVNYSIDYSTFLRQAASTNNIVLLEHVLKASVADNSIGRDIDFQDGYERTALDWALSKDFESQYLYQSYYLQHLL